MDPRIRSSLEEEEAMKRLGILAVATLLTNGCASFSDIVRERAAFDLQCPAPQVKVTELPGSAYGAEGCNQRVSYTCMSGAFGDTKRCYKDSENLTK